MERTKKVTPETNADEGKVLYRKEGRGSLLIGKRIIKPNQTFYAYPEEIPEAFKDLIKPVGGNMPEKTEKPIPGKKPVYRKEKIEMESGDEEQMYNILDAKGKKLNDDPLTGEDADSLIEKLSK